MINIKIFGINFAVSIGFVGFLCLMLYVDRAGMMLPTILAVTLHEFGHLTALLIFGAKPQRVELKVGAVAIIGNFVLTVKQRFIMLLSGSTVNFIVFVLLYCLYFVLQNLYLLNFSLVMFVVGVINLLPILGLDGGEILSLIFIRFMKLKSANKLVLVFSIVTILFVLLLGLHVLNNTKTNFSLIIFGIYLFLGILVSKKEKNDCKIPRNIVQYK